MPRGKKAGRRNKLEQKAGWLAKMLKLLLLTDLLTRRLWPSVYVLVSDLGDNKLKKRKQPNKSNSRLD